MKRLAIAIVLLMMCSCVAFSQSTITGVITQYAGGLVSASTNSVVVNGQIDAQGNFSLQVPQNPSQHLMTFTPPQGTPFTPFSVTVTAPPGVTTNVTAQIAPHVPVVGTNLGIPNQPVIGTDAYGNAIPGTSSGGSTITCLTSGGIVYWNGTAYVCTLTPTVSGLTISGATAAFIDFGQGSSPPTQLSNSVRWYAPVAVTSYANLWPATAPTTGNTYMNCPAGGGQCVWDTGFANGGVITASTIGLEPTSGDAQFVIKGSGGDAYILQGKSANTDFLFYDSTKSIEAWVIHWLDSTHPATQFPSGGLLGWNSASQFPDGTNPDTGLSRDSAGVLDLGNGASGDKTGTLNAGAINLATHPVPTVDTASPTAGQAVCIKAAGPPIQLGTCSSVVGAGGACTCN